MKEKESLAFLLLFFYLCLNLSGCGMDQEISNVPVISPANNGRNNNLQGTTPTLEIPVTPEPLSNPVPLQISNIVWTLDEFDSFRLLGLVQNNTNSPIKDIQLKISSYDENGNFLFSEKIGTLLINLSPHKVTPFNLERKGTDQDVDQVITEVLDYQLSETPNHDIQIQKELLTNPSETTTILSGELRNNHGDPIIIDHLAAGVFDKNGNLISISGEFTSIRYLDPGEIGPFQVTFLSADSTSTSIVDFQIYVEARISPPYPYIDLTIHEETTSYFDNLDKFHIIGETTNHDDRPVFATLIAGIYDEQGYVLDVSEAFFPRALTPGETLPYHFNQWSLMNSKSDKTDRAARFSIQVDPYLTHFFDSEFVALSIVEKNITYNPPIISIDGKIINDSLHPVKDALIIITIYDHNSNKVVATVDQRIEGIMPVGVITPFNIEVEPKEMSGFDEQDVSINVKGEVPTD